MPKPPTGLEADARLRHELEALVRGGQAHAGLRALESVPENRAADRAGGPHSLYDLVWHLRYAQDDLLEYATSPDYAPRDWPADYWPDAPPGPGDWGREVAAFRAGLEALCDLARTADLTAELDHAPGYTALRQILVAADHNAYHLGQVVALRRRLGLWPPGDGA